MTKRRFRKIKKWTAENGDIKLNNGNVLVFMFACMIPIVGQIVFVAFLYNAIVERDVYYEEQE